MPSGQELVNWSVARRGVPYSWEGRFGPNAYDCSGLVTADCWAHNLSPTGQNSTGLELWCRDNGLGVDVGAAIGVAGALVFVWGYGANGHVAMSMGDGNIVETPSAEGHCVGISPFWRSNWTGAAYIPGVDYGTVTPSDPVLQLGSKGDLVADWQRFLKVVPDDGDFGPSTEQGVKGFQSLFGLTADGVIGKQTWETRRFVENVQPPSPTPIQPTTFSLIGATAMSFASAVTPSAGVYETYRITADGTVQQWYFPRSTDLEHADVATGGKPGGDVQITRQTAVSGKVGRGDVWFQKPDGTLGHAFQHGDGDWTWNVDTLGW